MAASLRYLNQRYSMPTERTDDPLVTDVLRFLREREVVHFQRFGEALNDVQEMFRRKTVY